MTDISSNWTRRAFSHALALSTASAVLPWTRSARGWAHASQRLGKAYVASCSAVRRSDGAIRVFTIERGAWMLDQDIECCSPTHLEHHPSLPVLYAVHDVSLWDQKPRGAVSAYVIDPGNGRLSFRATQPLSLSATAPKHATVTRDGRDLVVAAHGGGSYNVLPLDDKGLPGAPRIIRKEVGRLHDGQAIPAAPMQVRRQPGSDLLIATDSGKQSITTFVLDDDSMLVVRRMHLKPGMSFSDIALFPSCEWAFALDPMLGTVGIYSLKCATGDLGQSTSTIDVPDARPGRITMHPSGKALVTAGLPGKETSLSVWGVEPRSGKLTLCHTVSLDCTVDKLFCMPGGGMLIATQASSAAIVGIPLERPTLRPKASRVLATVADASSMLFRNV